MKILEIKNERRKLKEVRDDIFILNGVRLKAGNHSIKHNIIYQTDFP